MVFALAVSLAACSTPAPLRVDGASGSWGTSSGGAGSGGNAGSGQLTGSGGPGGTNLVTVPDAAISGDAGSVICAEDAHQAESVPLDLMLVVDASGSMTDPVDMGTATKWELARRALVAFVRDPRSSGLSAGLQFFPYQPEQRACMTDGDCPGGSCLGPQTRCVNAAGSLGPPCVLVPGIPPSICPSGTTCAETGTCENTGLACARPGQACPSGGRCVPQSKTCYTATDECDVAYYQTPTVAIAALPGNEDNIALAFGSKSPGGGTPMKPAMEGAFQQMRNHLAANPGHKGAIVLATDGFPSCGSANGLPTVANLATMGLQGTPSISTYVIGVFASNEIALGQSQLDTVAKAGGTGQAFVINANQDLTKKLEEALDTIRGAALVCEFTIPTPTSGSIDYGKVNVRYTSNGASTDLFHVKSMGACDPTKGGWYYDVEPPAARPSRVLACPSTCQAFQSHAGVRVDLVFGCATKID